MSDAATAPAGGAPERASRYHRRRRGDVTPDRYSRRSYRPMRRRRHYPVVIALLAVWALPVAATEPSLDRAGPPPADLEESLAAALTSDGLRISLDGTATWELWTVRELPGAGGGDAVLGQELGALPRGGVVGAARLLTEWSDYRGTRIAPGLYTLRYLVAPADGAHLGTSLYRDFALLVPAAIDGGPGARYGFDELVALSREATGTNHPAIVALFPDWSAGGGETGAPALAANELDQPTVWVVVGPVRIGLVVQGRGES